MSKEKWSDPVQLLNRKFSPDPKLVRRVIYEGEYSRKMQRINSIANSLNHIKSNMDIAVKEITSEDMTEWLVGSGGEDSRDASDVEEISKSILTILRELEAIASNYLNLVDKIKKAPSLSDEKIKEKVSKVLSMPDQV